MKKIKVCILQNGLSFGGTDTFVLNLCRGIDKNKFEITILNPNRDATNDNQLKEFEKLGIQVVFTSKLSSIRSILNHLWLSYKFLKKERFDVFHTNVDLFNGLLLLPAYFAKVPIRVCHSHNTNQARDFLKEKTPIQVRIYQKIMKLLCFKLSNRRIGCSKEAMDFLFGDYNWIDSRYPQIIYNGIDIGKYQYEIDIPKKKNELGLKAKKNILVVGHFRLQKNPLYTVEIFREIAKRRSDINLVWVGSGELKYKVKEILAKYGILDRVIFLGNRKDVSDIMKCCDLFLLPSLFEGLGIVLIEAQASGLPCVVSNKVPEMSNCGGVVFQDLNDSPGQWADTIECNIDNSHIVTIKPALLYKFSIINMVSQIEKVYSKCE